MRGLKRNEMPILKGYETSHNYIGEHQGLKGKTLAEACGIRVEGKNKWKTYPKCQYRKLISRFLS